MNLFFKTGELAFLNNQIEEMHRKIELKKAAKQEKLAIKAAREEYDALQITYEKL